MLLKLFLKGISKTVLSNINRADIKKLTMISRVENIITNISGWISIPAARP